MFVPGAIAAICPARVINTPADAAWDPPGKTNTATGTGESSISDTITLVDFNKPPGVLSFIIRHSAFSEAAILIPEFIYSAVDGLMVASSEIAITFFPALVSSADITEAIPVNRRKKTVILRLKILIIIFKSN